MAPIINSAKCIKEINNINNITITLLYSYILLHKKILDIIINMRKKLEPAAAIGIEAYH